MKKEYHREIFMDGTVKLVDWRGNIVPEGQAFWIENGKEFTPTPLESPAKEVYFTGKTLHGLYILLCFSYFAFNYGLFKAYSPDFIEKKAAAALHGRNYYGWNPTN
jgi:hypothetical protein